jgi:hypothetical protein
MKCETCKHWSLLWVMADGKWGTCASPEVSEKVRGSDNAYGADEVKSDFGCIFWTDKLDD